MNLPALSFRKVLLTTGIAVLTASIVTEVVPSQARSSSVTPDLANGIYLYGQTPQPNQASKGYVVFQHNNGRVIGAFYYPRSEFECFQGNLDDTTLEIQPISTEHRSSEQNTAELDNFHQIPVSANDRRILAQCQQEVNSVSTLPRSLL